MIQDYLVAFAHEKINSHKDYYALSPCNLSIRKTYYQRNLTIDYSDANPFIVDWQIPKSELNNTVKSQEQ